MKITYQEDVFFSLRISRVAHVPRVFTLDVFDRRPLFKSWVMDSLSTSGSIAVPNAAHRSLKQTNKLTSDFLCKNVIRIISGKAVSFKITQSTNSLLIFKCVICSNGHYCLYSLLQSIYRDNRMHLNYKTQKAREKKQEKTNQRRTDNLYLKIQIYNKTNIQLDIDSNVLSSMSFSSICYNYPRKGSLSRQ